MSFVEVAQLIPLAALVAGIGFLYYDRMSRTHWIHRLPWLLLSGLLLGGCQPVAVAPSGAPVVTSTQEAPASEPTLAPARLVVYSGRNENLVGPLLQQFSEQTGIEVEVRYGGTAEMAATVLEEGNNSPADVFFAQDAGALGALARAGRLVGLPEAILARVPAPLRSANNDWVATSGRARVFVYNTDELTEADLPADIWGLTDPRWNGLVGWAPTNGSFQAFVTALRVLEGEARAREWLEAMLANNVQPYSNNTLIVEATARGEILIGLVNHYYLYQFLAEQGESFPARNYYPASGDAGAMINVAGVGILDTAQNREAAQRFVEYLLSPEAQQFFANETNEYPLVPGIEVNLLLKPLDEINMPDLDLNDLDDLPGTLTLLQEVGALD